MSIVLELLLLSLVLIVLAGCAAPLFAIGYIAIDLKRWADESSAKPEEAATEMCDGCGSGPWHRQWDPDSARRESRKFYCPNCTGAD